MPRRHSRSPLLALVALLALLVVGYVATTVSHDTHRSTSSTVALSSLPVQARQTVTSIRRGGPYPFAEDGEVFHNAGQPLPRERDGYYHSYTVVTPGSADRGARRIVTGAAGQFWYTPDHYQTFRRIDLDH